MKLHEFMIQSPTGKTHAINPKTKKTYCGFPNFLRTSEISEHTLENKGWRFLDVVPSEDHIPTCKICSNHYDDPLREELFQIAKDLRGSINDFLCTALLIKDIAAIGRFTENIATFMRNERKIREGKTNGTKN